MLTIQNPAEGQYIGPMNMNGSDGTANYSGLLLSVQRRAANGINIGGNYTWSRCIGDKFSAGGPGNGGYLNKYNRRFDRGNCDSDRRQYFNLTAVAQTPQFANNTMRMIASGWRLSGIYRRSTGSYMTITTGLDRALNGDATPQRADQILLNPYGDRSSLTNYLNPQAFAQPALGSFGNMGTYNIVGPSTFQFDMALSRVFGVREGQNIEVRAEAFNVTNSLRRGNPGVTSAGNTSPTVNLNSNTFGQILTSADARVMQFALKYTF